MGSTIHWFQGRLRWLRFDFRLWRLIELMGWFRDTWREQKPGKSTAYKGFVFGVVGCTGSWSWLTFSRSVCQYIKGTTEVLRAAQELILNSLLSALVFKPHSNCGAVISDWGWQLIKDSRTTRWVDWNPPWDDTTDGPPSTLAGNAE